MDSRVWVFLLFCGLLGGSWVVISGVISRVTIIITPIRGLITLLITTHEPPSRVAALRLLRRMMRQIGRKVETHLRLTLTLNSLPF